MLMSLKNSFTTSDYLPYSEYRRLIDCLEDDGDYRGAAYCTLSFALALRVSDVLKLRWCQIIGHRNIVVTEKKTKKTKSIPIGEQTEEKIHELFFKMGSPNYEGYILKNEKTEQPLTIQHLNRTLKWWKTKYNLKIDNLSTHSFRKTFGRYVYEKMGRTQEALVLLSHIFRHANISITMVYIGLKEDDTKHLFEGLWE